jgi:hypothetical protein
MVRIGRWGFDLGVPVMFLLAAVLLHSGMNLIATLMFSLALVAVDHERSTHNSESHIGCRCNLLHPLAHRAWIRLRHNSCSHLRHLCCGIGVIDVRDEGPMVKLTHLCRRSGGSS